VPFYHHQQRVVLGKNGLVDPREIDDYLAWNGYSALTKTLTQMTPAQAIATIKESGLRGRGGAGFPTATKWAAAARNIAALRTAGATTGDGTDTFGYVICNGDEGDPGAFMDRSILEGNPHGVLEGLIIGGYVLGANVGYFYIRDEYPLAIVHMTRAIEQATEYGLVGHDILGSGFDFQVKIARGSGAFVCGEETALIASIEGERGMPCPRPPYPAQVGLWGKPTVINNVKTWTYVPLILERGAAWFKNLGTPTSPGTAVFSLVGKVNNTGLVEVPMGTPLRELVHVVGGGIPKGKKLKAVQTGGPSGGCIPADLLDTPVDYEALGRIGSMMGSGGMVVMDENTCMVDIARYFLTFTQIESCGKCAPCRLGTQRMLEILIRITEGKGSEADLRTLEEFAATVKATSLCGLGQTAPNPVLTTLKFFRHEYEEHIRERRCQAGVCQALFLAPCENSCPLHMNIPGYLQLLKEDRFDEALELVLLDNPLPASTGRVCQHPCENRCRRATLDTAVNMREVHRYLADVVFDRMPDQRLVQRLKRRKLPATGKHIAIVGAGPAGLTAAFYLTLLGHKVTVLESAAKPGGMLRYALPSYRLPKKTLDREISLVRGLGARFVCNTALGRDLTLEKLAADHDGVFLSFGTWQEQDLGVPGRELEGVFPALDFLSRLGRGEKIELGRQVAVIGGGNAAIDSARTALRLGAEVRIVYRRARQDMPAIPEEIEEALEEGARLVTLVAPLRVIGEHGRVTGLEVAKTVLGPFDAGGRRTPVLTDEKYVIPCGTIIEAIGERVEQPVAQALGLPLNKSGTIKVDPWTLQTSHPKVFAGGDVVSGAANVTTAMGFGKKAAATIDHQLTGEDRLRRLWPPLEYDNTPPPSGQGRDRNTAKVTPCATRRRSFDEVSHTFSARQAKAEALRCLRCDIKATAEGQP
jgi:NADH-quinone oxidoreductase subunit F